MVVWGGGVGMGWGVHLALRIITYSYPSEFTLPLEQDATHFYYTSVDYNLITL